MTAEIDSYLEQSSAVRERFDRLKARPVKLEAKNLYKSFTTSEGKDIEVLRDISFKLHRREFLSVIGPSGCGKSTLIRILAGLETASEGEVTLSGGKVRGPGADRGMVFQSYTLFHWLTVKENVMFGPITNGQSRSRAESQAREWIYVVGLERFENAYPSQLSGGMKQRVAIARALANQPEVLLLDEPFGALDAQTRVQMQAYLLEIWKNIDVSIAFITHDLDEAVYLSDRVLVLSANPGRVHELIEVPVPRPRSIAQFSEPEFLAVRRRLAELIHPAERAESRLRITRMTEKDDEVE